MDILHLCRLCLTNSGYHFNMFTEIISNKHLYQLVNNICEVGVLRNDGLPEYICENCYQSIRSIISFKTQAKETEATLTRMKRFRNMNSAKKEIVADAMVIVGGNNESDEIIKIEPVHSNENLTEDDTLASDVMDIPSGMPTIKREIDIDEIAIPAEQVTIEKIIEIEVTPSLEHLNEMETIPAGKEKCVSQEEGVSAISLDGNTSLDDDESISQEFLEVRRRLECHHCGVKRETKQEISQHIEDAHNYIFNENNTPNQQQRKYKKHICSTCERGFKEKSSLARHMLIHTGERPFQCNICNYSCSRSESLKYHMLKHTGEKPFQCNICNYRCTQSGHLLVHMRMHSGEKPFLCNVCTYSSSRRGDFIRHMRKHTGEKPFQCNICNFSFSQSYSLKLHKRIHTGEKPFQCNSCNYSCSKREQLAVHMRKHTGERPFKCNICNYCCSHSGVLKNHMQKHTGKKFQCNICNYSCSRSWDLKVHMRIHTGEKPFRCNICNYCCSRSGYLKIHMRKHTEDRPFQCNICNYSCSESGRLGKHMRKHTGVNKVAN